MLLPGISSKVWEGVPATLFSMMSLLPCYLSALSHTYSHPHITSLTSDGFPHFTPTPSHSQASTARLSADHPAIYHTLGELQVAAGISQVDFIITHR